MKHIGLFGGSFNPIHKGHIGLAKHILELAKLDEVWFMVSPLNPLKQGNTDILENEKRLELARIALQDNPRLKASDFEFHLPTPSYTWQTLQSLAVEYPDYEFFLIIGADNWLLFDRWFNADEIVKNYRILVYPRTDCPVDAATLPANVTLLNTPLYNVSSTEIRQRIRNGKSVARLLPRSIVEKATEYYSR